MDPGSSASVMSFDLFKRVGQQAGIKVNDLCPNVYTQGTTAVCSGRQENSVSSVPVF